MTLIVSVYHRDPITQKIAFVEPDKPGQDLAGFESWRTQVWGSEAIKKQGAKFLPQLTVQDLYIENEQLMEFKIECEMLLKSLDSWAKPLKDSRSITFRLNNILLAIEEGLKIKGGVYIG